MAMMVEHVGLAGAPRPSRGRKWPIPGPHLSVAPVTGELSKELYDHGVHNEDRVSKIMRM